MKKIILCFVVWIFVQFRSHAQGLHYSQYYNSPMLLNPANTGLIQDNDWCAGIQYRNQGATIPIPYNTFSAFSDFGIGRAKWETSWIGAGVAVWRDAAGDGQLALTKIQGNLAYHVLMNENSSFSAGMSISNNQRTVDFSKLTYDVQWDEFTFDRSAPNMESNTTQKSSFTDIGAGINYAYYNNTNFYMKTSIGFMHINRPLESFYGESNRLGVRPNFNIDVVYKANSVFIINPSIYYASQKKASQLIAGSLVNINTSRGGLTLGSNEVILGLFYRNNDAIVSVAGYKFKNHRFTVSYDHTISQLSAGNGGLGALEFSLILQGNYRSDDGNRTTYGCPRF